MPDEFLDTMTMRTSRDLAQDQVAFVTSLSPLEVSYKGSITSAVHGIPNQILTVGDPVRVTFYAQQLVIYAVAVKYPTLAVVSAYTSGADNCTVISGDDKFDVQIASSLYTPIVGERVVLYWTAEGGFVLGKRGKASSPVNPPMPPDYMNSTEGTAPVPPPPPVGPVTVTMLTQQIGNYNYNGDLVTSGNYKYMVYQNAVNSVGDYYDGAYFLGDQVNKIKGQAAFITGGKVYLQRATGVGSSGAMTIHLFLHKFKTRPSNIFSQVRVDNRDNFVSLKPGQGGWYTLPIDWVQKIAQGLAAGVGFYTLYDYTVEKQIACVGIDNTTNQKNVNAGAIQATYNRS